jgi:copper chaperone CopZ
VHVALFQKHEFKMEMTCEGCSNAAKRVLGKIGGMYHVLDHVLFFELNYTVTVLTLNAIRAEKVTALSFLIRCKK